MVHFECTAVIMAVPIVILGLNLMFALLCISFIVLYYSRLLAWQCGAWRAPACLTNTWCDYKVDKSRVINAKVRATSCLWCKWQCWTCLRVRRESLSDHSVHIWEKYPETPATWTVVDWQQVESVVKVWRQAHHPNAISQTQGLHGARVVPNDCPLNSTWI